MRWPSREKAEGIKLFLELVLLLLLVPLVLYTLAFDRRAALALGLNAR